MLPLQTRCRPSKDSLSAVVGNQSSLKADVFFFFQREIGLGLKSLFSREKGGVFGGDLFQREGLMWRWWWWWWWRTRRRRWRGKERKVS
jgi:hypothetical protein